MKPGITLQKLGQLCRKYFNGGNEMRDTKKVMKLTLGILNRGHFAWILIIAIFSWGCSSDSESNGSCTSNNDCPTGQYCGTAQKCTSDCRSSSDCPNMQKCNSYGKCVSDSKKDGGIIKDGPMPNPDINVSPDVNQYQDVKQYVDMKTLPDTKSWPDATPWPDSKSWPDATPWPDSKSWPDTIPTPDKTVICGPSSCAGGCCLQGVCVIGKSFAACGKNGVTCATCNLGQVCANQTCGKCTLNSECDAVSICVKGNCQSPWGIPYNIQVTAATINQYSYATNPTGAMWDATGKGLPDPFVKITAGTSSWTSVYLEDTLSPVWLGGLSAHLSKSTLVGFAFWDYDSLSFNDSIGGTTPTTLSMQELKQGGATYQISDPKYGLQKLTAKYTPLGNQLGDLCYTSSLCDSSMTCLFTTATLGFCTIPCTSSGALCTGTPTGTVAFCTAKNTSVPPKYYCQFYCAYQSSGTTVKTQCPSSLTCNSSYICEP